MWILTVDLHKIYHLDLISAFDDIYGYQKDLQFDEIQENKSSSDGLLYSVLLLL